MTAGRILAIAGTASSVLSFVGMGMALFGAPGCWGVTFAASTVMLGGNLLALRAG